MTIANTTTKTAATVNAAAIEAVKAETLNWAAPTRMGVEFKPFTMGQVLDDWASGAISRPLFQRQPLAWVSVKGQMERYEDTLLNGIPLPAIVLARFPNAAEGTPLLLLDGQQRVTSAEYLLEKLDDSADPLDAEKAEFIRETPVTAMIVDCPTVAAAVELFIRYNMGVKLDGAQTGKASLPESMLAVLQTYTDRLNSIGKDRFGKKGAEAASIMLAACVVDFAAYNGNGKAPYKRKASTSAAAAAKVLNSAAALPAIPDAVERALTALQTATSPTAVTYWASPARLIPLAWAAMETGATVDAMRQLIDTLDVKDTTISGRAYTGWKNGCAIHATVKLSEAMAATANSPAATATRADILAYILSGKAEADKAKKAEKAAAKAAAKAAVNIPEGAAMTAEEAAEAVANIEAALGM